MSIALFDDTISALMDHAPLKPISFSLQLYWLLTLFLVRARCRRSHTTPSITSCCRLLVVVLRQDHSTRWNHTRECWEKGRDSMFCHSMFFGRASLGPQEFATSSLAQRGDGQPT